MSKIPTGWNLKTILEFSPMQRGFDLTNSQIVDGPFPVVYSNGIRNFHNEAKVKGPGVITGRSGTIGNLTYVESDYWPHNTSLWITDFKGNLPKYVFYALQFLKLDRFDAGSGVPTLNRNDVHRQQILVPPLPEQKKIVHLLSTWDSAIEKMEKLTEEKEKRFKWLIKALIGNQCRHWKHFHTEDIFDSISEKKNGTEELLSVTQDRGVIPRSMLEGRVMSPEGSTEGYKLIKGGDFAISLRSFQGGIEYSCYQGLISPAYTVLRPKLKIDSEFYRHFFKTYIFTLLSQR